MGPDLHDEEPPGGGRQSGAQPDRTHPAADPDRSPDGEGGPAAGSVTRSVAVDAPVGHVWEALLDPGRRSTWLDDEDARARVTRIDDVDPGRSLAWTWWDPGDAGSATEVRFTLEELPAARTRVVVTERPAPAAVVLDARAGPTAAGSPQARVGARAGTWDLRLLGLELLFAAAAAVLA